MLTGLTYSWKLGSRAATLLYEESLEHKKHHQQDLRKHHKQHKLLNKHWEGQNRGKAVQTFTK